LETRHFRIRLVTEMVQLAIDTEATLKIKLQWLLNGLLRQLLIGGYR